MIPAMPCGPSASAITQHVGRRARAPGRRACAASRPARARRAISSAPRIARVVVGVQRAAEVVHHVVRDVDDVRDRAHAGRLQARLEPQRRRADRDVLEDARREARAEVLVLDRDRDPVGREPVAERRRLARRRAASGSMPKIACTSRATPRIESRSARFEVTSSSSTSWASGTRAASGSPGFQPSPSTMIPSPSEEMSSSRSDRIMPSEVSPRSFERRDAAAVEQHRARAARRRRCRRRRSSRRRTRSGAARAPPRRPA